MTWSAATCETLPPEYCHRWTHWTEYVVKSKETGKGKTLAKNQPKQQAVISVNVEKMDALMDALAVVLYTDIHLSAFILSLQGNLSFCLLPVSLTDFRTDLTNFQKAAAQLAKNTTELQDVIMSMRMMPLTTEYSVTSSLVEKPGNVINLNISFSEKSLISLSPISPFSIALL